MTVKRIAIFGATGRTGQHLVEQALEVGYHVVAFARTPSKLTIEHDRLTVVEGNLQDQSRVEEAVAGLAAVISVLGPTSNTPDYKVSRGVETILAAMRQHGIRRLVISAGAGVPDPNDEPKPLNKVIGALVRLLSRHVYEDMRRTVNTVRESDADWTIVRVPMLTGQPATGHLRVGYVGKGTGPRLSRADLARFMLKQVEDDTYLCQAPVISN